MKQSHKRKIIKKKIFRAKRRLSKKIVAEVQELMKDEEFKAECEEETKGLKSKEDYRSYIRGLLESARRDVSVHSEEDVKEV